MKARLQKFNLLVERAFFNRLGQANVMPVFLLIFLLFFSVMIAFNMHRFPPLAVMGVVAAMCVMVLTLININFGLVILIFSMLWSPEMPIGKTIERAIVLRVDDFLIIGVFFAWLGRLAFTRQTQTLRHTPINTLVFLYIGANIVSTSLGVMAGDVDAVVGFFYVLKFVEYFMLYFLFVNNITDMKQFKVFIFCFFLTAFTIGIFTYMQFGGWERPTAPFEGAHGEPNTLGGYLMLCILVAAGLYIHQRATLGKVITGGLCLFLLPPIAMTLSRSAYVG
jgi:hypothetical protein